MENAGLPAGQDFSLKDLRERRICSAHFEGKCYKASLRKHHLEGTAVPTLFPGSTKLCLYGFDGKSTRHLFFHHSETLRICTKIHPAENIDAIKFVLCRSKYSTNRHPI